MSDTSFSDLDRPPLNSAALTRGLVGLDGRTPATEAGDGIAKATGRRGDSEALWCEIRVVEETGSTNADLAAAAREGAAEGVVLVAEAQTSGRGRLDRTFTSPPRAALTFSVLLRPDGAAARRRGLLPLLVGVAVAGSLRRFAGVDARLKWPNDVLIGDRKLAGILAEQAGGAVIIGIGLNVSTRRAELPVPGATSLVLEKAVCTDRDPLLRAVLADLERWYRTWLDAAGNPDASGLRAAYRELSATIGRDVRAELPDETMLAGTAVDIDSDGRLMMAVASSAETVAISAGDVIHLR